MNPRFLCKLIPLFVWSFSAVVQADIAQFPEVKKRYQEECENVCAPLGITYREHLNGLKQRYTDAENLAGVVAVEREIYRVTPVDERDDPDRSFPETYEDPEQLLKMRSVYERQKEMLTAPVTSNYERYLRDLLALLKKERNDRVAMVVENELSKLNRNSKSGGPNRLVIWNQHNGDRYDRGSKKANIVFYDGDREVWRQDSVTLVWKERRGASTEIDVPAVAADRIRIEVTDFHERGGGLAEIEFYRNGDNVLRGKRTAASSFWQNEADFAPEHVTDGRQRPTDRSHGYWLLPNQTTGWIDVFLEN